MNGNRLTDSVLYPTAHLGLLASGWHLRAERLSKMGRLRRRKRRIWVDARRNGGPLGPETRGCLTRGLRRGGVQSCVMGSSCCLWNNTLGHHWPGVDRQGLVVQGCGWRQQGSWLLPGIGGGWSLAVKELLVAQSLTRY